MPVSMDELIRVCPHGFPDYLKTVKSFRMEDEKEDCSWALALDDSERIAIATRLVNDLWSVAHDEAPFPSMDRTTYNYISKVKI